MSRCRLAYLTSVAVFMAPCVWADVTAEDVWNDWKSNIESFGYTYSADETASGNVLTVSNFVVSSETPDGTGAMQASIERIVFTENSDGSVSIKLPAEIPFEMNATPEGEGPLLIAMALSQDGLTMTASGTSAAMTYDYAASSIAIASTKIEIDGEVLPPETNLFEANFVDMSGRTDMLLDSMRRQTQAMQIGSLSYTLRIVDPTTNQLVDATATGNDLRFDGTSATPLRVVQADNMSAMLDAGFRVDGTFTMQENTSEFASSGPDGSSTGQFKGDSGSFTVKLGDNGLTYAGDQTGLDAQITSSGIPIPLSFAAERAGFNLTMPLQKSDEAQDFGLGVELSAFSVSDVLWGLFDPTAQLPRDPATLVLDLAGKGRLLFDFLDPDAASISGNPNITPAEVQALDINKLQISLAGAELTGTGAFTFDNTPGSAPKPVGAADLMLVGGNALLDKLVGIGIIPQEQATGVRLMMGLLAVPGNAPDTLNSRIEMNDQGHILANGQRIQ